MTQRFTTPDGLSLAYDDQGHGPALLCLSGLTRNRKDFDHVLPHLTGLRVIRMDYRGRGESDWADPATYTVMQEAKDALALMDHLGLDRVAVLGTSRGGLIAMVLAQIAKERLSGVVLNDIGPVIEPAGLERIAQYIGRRPAAKTLEDYARRLESAQPGFVGVPQSRWLAEARNQVRETGKGLDLTYDPALRDSFMAGLVAPAVDLWPLFDALSDLPLVALRGENSDLLSEATFDEMKRRQGGGIFVTVRERAHVPFLDEPESLDALREFAGALA